MSVELVTIGLACYNASQTVGRAVESARAQIYPNFEIVIVDDASADGSWDKLQALARAHPDQIRIFRNEKNLGVAGTRNRILAEARGAFIVFFDDDDVSQPERVLEQISAIEAYEEKFAKGAPVICHTARRQIFPDGRAQIVGTLGCVGAQEQAPCGLDVARAILFNKRVRGGNGALATCSQAARVSTYRALGGFDTSFRRAEDTDFCLRLALAGGHFLGISRPLVDQYMTRAEDKVFSNERLYAAQLYQKHEDFLKSENRGTFDLDWLQMKHDYLEHRMAGFATKLALLFVVHPVLSAEKLARALPNFHAQRQIKKFHQERAAS